jgi:hypothetical protein
MNDQEITRTQIEQATARQLPPGASLDHETRTLRHGWLALGGSLERTAQGLDQAALVASLQAELIDQPQRVQPAAQSGSRSWWPAVLGTALALTMLLAVVRSLPWGGSTDLDGQTVLTTGPDSYLPEPAAWSDPLDDEIVQAAEQVQALIAQSPGIDESLTGISQELESISDDLQHGSL